jgi:hypothetical protein
MWTVTDAAGLSATATQIVTVADTTAPVITSCPQPVTFTAIASGSYTVPLLTATDNCGNANVTYSISGATRRDGTGANASGSFDVGTSTITWTVTDADGNSTNCQTVVTVQTAPAPLTVSIPDVWLVKPGGEQNTIYIGYGPSSGTLTAQPKGGAGGYSYRWSTGATTADITVNPTATTVYSVVVTDAQGAQTTATKVITVRDIRCGAKLEKISVCETKKGKGSTFCLRTTEVAAKLQAGAMLGACASVAITSSQLQTAALPDQAISEAEELSASVAPNPSSAYFRLTVSSPHTSTPVKVRIVDMNGRVLEAREGILPGNAIRIGEYLKAGVYIIEIWQKNLSKAVKIIKQ